MDVDPPSKLQKRNPTQQQELLRDTHPPQEPRRAANKTRLPHDARNPGLPPEDVLLTITTPLGTDPAAGAADGLHWMPMDYQWTAEDRQWEGAQSHATTRRRTRDESAYPTKIFFWTDVIMPPPPKDVGVQLPSTIFTPWNER